MYVEPEMFCSCCLRLLWWHRSIVNGNLREIVVLLNLCMNFENGLGFDVNKFGWIVGGLYFGFIKCMNE